MIKKTLMASAAMVAFMGVAVAADIPMKAAPAQPIIYPNYGSWTGWYLAGMVGYGYDLTGTNISSAAGLIGTLGSVPSGITGGGKLGYDGQMGAGWVLGIVTSINGANFNNNTSLGGAVSTSANVRWWGDVDARLGFLGFGNHWMPYVMGGVAYGGTSSAFTVGGFTNAVSNTSVGWDAGGGLEVRLDKNWSVFGEGKYVALGNTVVPLNAALLTSSQKYNFGVFDIGIKYLF